ncbi:MAG: aminotransferase class V-fold PLP-dependent enzyme [Gammaproteobacteria bacterium]|jgi:selenocysteine lyase/cysteine desulfurase
MIDETILEKEFPHHEGLIYLNHAAVAPWPARTAQAVKEFAQENIHYGASRYPNWVKKEDQLRGQLQRLINAPSVDDIALLKNTSEGLSIVASGIAWQSGDNIVSSDEEFPSNRIPWEAQAVHGVEFRQINLKGDDPEVALIQACDKKTRLLTISSVQYASGLKLDLGRLGEFCRSNGILFCVDAIQSIGATHLDVQAIHADFVMADGHKWMLGPEGVALFYTRPEARDQLTLHQHGWHMVESAGNYDLKTWKPANNAKRFECGSNNMLGIHALSASISLFDELGMDKIENDLMGITGYLMEQLMALDEVELLTPQSTKARAGIVSFRFDGKDHGLIHQNLLKQGVICAYRGGGIRFSPHFYTSRKIIDKALEVLSLTI